MPSLNGSRYAVAWRRFWLSSLAAEAEYRLNFILATTNSLLALAGSIFGLHLFFRTGYRLGGWSWEEALLVMGVFTLLDGFASALLNPNLNRIVSHIRDGTMDFILLKPMDSQFWVSARHFSLWGVPNVLFGLITLGYAGKKLGFGWTEWAQGSLPVALAVLILYSLWFALAATSVWFVKIYNVTFVLRSFLEAGRFPISAFPQPSRFFFTFILPVAFLTTVPAESMLGRTGAGNVAWAGVTAILLLLLSRWFWRFSLRFYTSASS
ncbi:MAG: ABC transporter permease [Lentisphaerae bacterium RIFOXYB12_FULL_65_16]|nr:MAG: ABC transporter permease [Lentisphaerae bacterium RIFOXYA12_64_32]OGV92163.1 MAG: ABC transporter permease [Lentisphaerae bacterium RIFOXYB12_FULL_65_16]